MKITLKLVITTIILNLIAFSRAFCDIYTDYFYPILNTLIGSLTSWCPFAIGEIIMYLGAIMIICAIPVSIILIFLRKNNKYKTFAQGYLKTLLLTFIIFLFIYTVNWFIPFRATVLKVSENTRTNYTTQEVAYVRALIVQKLNETAHNVPRDNDGHLKYDYNEQDIITAMQNKSSEYSRLSGHYSHPKTALCSDFLEWMSIGGYNYIYTMEPTINRYVDPFYMPVLIAHEYAHHKGYYKENEAEFISCITLINSSNIYLHYGAYYEMYWYIDDAYYNALINDIENSNPALTIKEKSKAISEIYKSQPTIDSVVYKDIEEAQKISDDFYNENVNQTLQENFEQVSEDIAEDGWEIQANVLKENIYDGITLMLLQYYIEK